MSTSNGGNVAGVHLMAVGNEHRIPAMLRLAGLDEVGGEAGASATAGRRLVGLDEVGGEAGAAATAGRRLARADATRGGLGGSSPQGNTSNAG